jgi:Flp pilus assembly pilin Flp
MRRILARFWSSEEGQDLVEYALLLGFVCLAGVAAFVSMGGLTSALWRAANNRLAANNVS